MATSGVPNVFQTSCDVSDLRFVSLPTPEDATRL